VATGVGRGVAVGGTVGPVVGATVDGAVGSAVRGAVVGIGGSVVGIGGAVVNGVPEAAGVADAIACPDGDGATGEGEPGTATHDATTTIARPTMDRRPASAGNGRATSLRTMVHHHRQPRPRRGRTEPPSAPKRPIPMARSRVETPASRAARRSAIG
jgi:hypothetical protein